jgi:UDPglucose 6-dehydrogenase
MDATVGTIGLWHLGCVLSAAWFRLGQTVIGFDHDPARIEDLKRGTLPLYEPGLSEVVREGLRAGKLAFSADVRALAPCDFIFLAYDTPVREDDSSDPAILERAVEDVRPVMKDGAVLIVSSQSPIGLCRELRRRLQRERPNLELAYSPENLRLGDALRCYLEPGRIILGAADDGARDKCRELFSLLPAEILSMSLESAEIVKHGINSFLATSIVFANQLADICEAAGGRIDDVVAGLKSDPRIGPRAYLGPGIGFSGGTLGRDLKVLDEKNSAAGGAARLFGLVHALNAERKQTIFRRIERILGGCAGRTVGVLGATYKPGTSTLRRSLPLEIVDLLLAKKAEVRVYDPKADYAELGPRPGFRVAASLTEAAAGADLLVLMTEWPEFRAADWGAVAALMRQRVIFDAKNYLDEAAIAPLGLVYHSVGR